MILSRIPQNHLPAILSLIFCCALGVVGILSRPIFPVDETRYLTVAWEMFSRGDWLLPTLNFEPYHHKPPLLFWLVMSLWSIFGVSQEVAMIVPYLISFTVCALLIRLVRILNPDSARLPLLTILLFIGSLPFVVYSHLIMFDMLLSIFVLLGITAIWQFAHTGKWQHILVFALAVGGGVLAKGPVVLLHAVFPILLMPLWLPKEQRIVSGKKWALAFLGGILLGAAIALSWAIPAALRGGPEFTEKIFWGQTAGRVAKSFDHARPVWWYLPFLPVFLLPWLGNPGVWQGLKKLAASTQKKVMLFLGCWLVPVFLSFSLISGKQVHYLLPLLPGLYILLALGMDQMQERLRTWYIIPVMIICATLCLLPAIGKFFAEPIAAAFPDDPHVLATLQKSSAMYSIIAAGFIVLSTTLLIRGNLQKQLAGVSAAMVIFMSCLQIEAKLSVYPNYDLRPIANVIQSAPEVPLAFVRNYHGEWGFLARLNRPVKQIDVSQLDSWFNENPNGIAIIRTKRTEEFARFDVLFSMPYRMTNTYAVIVAPGNKDYFKSHDQ